MKRLIILLIPLAAIVAGATDPAPPGPPPAEAAPRSDLWASSITAEKSGDYDNAILQVTAYRQADGDRYLGALRLGWLWYLKADQKKALENYLAAAQLQPSAITPQLGVLKVAQAGGDPAKIQAAAEGVLRIEPTDYTALMALANVFFRQPEYRKALSTYRRALTFYPEDIDATSGAAWSLFYLGEKRDAHRMFKKILGVNQTYPFAQQGFDLSAEASIKTTFGTPHL